MMLRIENITFSYKRKKRINVVLKEINQTFESGKIYGIIGESGSGKSTLLSILAGLRKPDTGDVLYNEETLATIGLNKYRENHIGMVFQDYNLIYYMTAVQNLEVAKKGTSEQMMHWLDQLEITEEIANRPVYTLSGGQRQRVAIARALYKDANVILADEPTGNLNEELAMQTVEILKYIAHTLNKCVIVVTHSKMVSSETDIRLELNDGKLIQI